MTRIWQSRLFVVVCLLLGAAMFAACGRDTPSQTGSKAQTVEVLCTRCGAQATLQIAGAAKDETWPKPCPSCKRSGAYPAGKCSQCGKLVPFMDLRTRGYAEPRTCPHCGRPWQPQS